jgi:hypothetical protein
MPASTQRGIRERRSSRSETQQPSPARRPRAARCGCGPPHGPRHLRPGLVRGDARRLLRRPGQIIGRPRRPALRHHRPMAQGRLRPDRPPGRRAAWCWLTRPGLAAAGLDLTPTVPSLERFAHLRAVAAVRLSLESGPAWAEGYAHWRSERKIRHAMGGRLPAGHIPTRKCPGPTCPAPRTQGDVGYRGRVDPQAPRGRRAAARGRARGRRPTGYGRGWVSCGGRGAE